MNIPMLPGGRPGLKKEQAEAELAKFGDHPEYPVKILGIRGYYKDTMGQPGVNDIRIYDDALFIVGPGFFKSYNANVDPSRQFPGVATLAPGGPYLFKIGMHGISGDHPYLALRQYGNVTVLRDGKPHTDTPATRFWIDIHRGGINTTSSLGCQTIPPAQWDGFFRDVTAQMASHGQDIVPYFLTYND